MKKIFKFIFNLARNLSLFIVLAFLGLSAYLSSNEKVAEDFFNTLDKFEEKDNKSIELYTRDDSVDLTNFSQDDEEVGIMGIQEPSLDSYKTKKYKINLGAGSAYLRPSQIMYVNSNPVKIILTDESIIKPKMTLYELEELFNKNPEEQFFKIKTAIFNCNYIKQLIKESSNYGNTYSYQHIVTMEDGERINISRYKAVELTHILENLSI